MEEEEEEEGGVEEEAWLLWLPDGLVSEREGPIRAHLSFGTHEPG